MAFRYCAQFPQNSQVMQIKNVGRQQEFNMSLPYSLNFFAALFSSRSGAPCFVSWLIGSNSITERNDQCLGSLDDIYFVAKLP